MGRLRNEFQQFVGKIIKEPNNAFTEQRAACPQRDLVEDWADKNKLLLHFRDTSVQADPNYDFGHNCYVIMSLHCQDANGVNEYAIDDCQLSEP